MADNDDQSRSDNIFYMKQLHARSCKALGIDEDANSWFDIVDGLEVLAKKGAEADHELALLMNKHYRKPWCCKFAGSTNGWNHDSNCKNFVVCY